jgi:hypothetical protein
LISTFSSFPSFVSWGVEEVGVEDEEEEEEIGREIDQ